MYNGHQGEKSMLLESWKCVVVKNGKRCLGNWNELYPEEERREGVF